MRALHKENYLVRHYGDRFCKDEKFGDIVINITDRDDNNDSEDLTDVKEFEEFN